MLSLKAAYQKTYQSLKGNKTLFLPFVIFAAVELLALIVLYLAPRMPLKLFLGPLIRALAGEQFLHYPVNFILIPKWMGSLRTGITVLLGSFLTGAATILAYNAYQKINLNFKNSLKIALKKYISLFAIVLVFTVLFYFLNWVLSKALFKLFVKLPPKILFLNLRAMFFPALFCLNFVLAVLVQAAFVYAIPVLMIDGQTLTKSILKSFGLFMKYFLKTIILVGFPMLLYVPLMILQTNPSVLIIKLFPESVLLVSFLSLAISSLVIDLWVTLSATNFYLLHKEK